MLEATAACRATESGWLRPCVALSVEMWLQKRRDEYLVHMGIYDTSITCIILGSGKGSSMLGHA